MVCFCCFLIWDIVCPKAFIHTVPKTYKLQFYLAVIHRLTLLLFAWPWFLQSSNHNLGCSYSATWSCVGENKKTNTTTQHRVQLSLSQEEFSTGNQVHKTKFRKLMCSWVIKIVLSISYLQGVVFKNVFLWTTNISRSKITHEQIYITSIYNKYKNPLYFY